MKNLILFAFVLVSHFGFGQGQGSTDYPVDPNFVEVEIASTATDCVGPRESIWELEEEERGLLRDCMMEYISQENPDWQSGDPLRERYPIVWDHTRNGAALFWHNNMEVGFFTEHRNYIQGMEQFLLDNGCEDFVPLPKYDPKTMMPDEFFDADLAVIDGFGVLNDQTPDYDMVNVNENTCDQFSSIDAFASYVENQHNDVHRRIGGAMRDFDSPSAAIFWLWHAKVDDMYNCFQQICQDCEPAFVRARTYAKHCAVCFDFSKSTNVTEMDIQIIDADGNPTTITLNSWSNCISYEQLSSGASYSATINGTNDTNEACRAEDEVTIYFSAPIIPETTNIGGHPCDMVVVIPQFPFHTHLVGDDGSTDKLFKIISVEEDRLVSISHVNTLSGTLHTVFENQLLIAEEEIMITVPGNKVGTGTNHLLLFVDGETVDLSYVIIPN